MSILAAVVLTVLTIAVIRERALGEREALAARDAIARAAWPEAVAHARAAAEALAPASPWPEEGMVLLRGIAVQAQARGDRPVALVAYGAMRTAVLDTQAPGVDRSRWRRLADQAISRMALQESSIEPRVNPQSAALADLQRDRMPSTVTFAALAACAWVIIGCAAYALGSGSLSPRVRFWVRATVAAATIGYGGLMLLS